MVHFTITFAFSISSESSNKFRDDQLNDQSKKKTSKNRRKGGKIKSDTSLGLKSSENVINVNRLLAELHVEYELLPNCNFAFDCRCWDTAAKIYTETEDRSLKPISCIVHKNVIWVVFSVYHTCRLNATELRKFFNHVIRYRVFFGGTKLLPSARKDKVKKFYIKDPSVAEDDFLEIYDSPDFVAPTKPPFLSDILINENDENSIFISRIEPVPDRIHRQKYWKMLNENSFPLIPVDSRIVEKAEKRMNTNAERKTANKGKFGELTLFADVFFAEMGTITLYTNNSQIPGISSILIYIDCNDLLRNKVTRISLNPLTIKLEKLLRFPSDVLLEDNFSRIYAKILFMDNMIVTSNYGPSQTICFEHIKSFLYEQFQSEQLISFLLTEALMIQIIGIKSDNNVILKRSDKSHHKRQFKPSKLLETSKPLSSFEDEILLGVAIFDLSDLLKGSCEVSLTNGLFHPKDVHCSPREDLITLCRNSPLSSEILISYSTSVKIKVRLAAGLQKVHQDVLRRPDSLNRIFLILTDLQLANDIVDGVTSFNSNIVKSDFNRTTKLLITGFVIDGINVFCIFLEGVNNGYIRKVWEKVKYLEITKGRVFYNSEYVFLSRLYEDFIPSCGIAKIKLREPLEQQLRDLDLYLTKESPKINVLKTIGLMKLSSTMRSMCQMQLHPMSKDIAQFNLDLHVPYSRDCAVQSNSQRKEKDKRA